MRMLLLTSIVLALLALQGCKVGFYIEADDPGAVVDSFTRDGE